MIEVVSEPRDLSTWDKNQNPFYLELYGETSPTVDEAHAEVLPSAESSVRTTTDAPVYEYWWTLGHGGTPTRPRWPHTRGKEPWQDLRSTAAHVFLYFPLSAGWRVSEIAATLKYLSPVPEQHDWLKAVARGLHEVQPLFADASRVADFVPGGGATSKWLQAVSKLQVSSVPSGSNLKWSVRKVTFGSESGVMQGVMWTISRAAFDRLGGRLTGSLAVSFLPARSQEPDRVRDLPPYQEADLLAHAGVFGHSQARWLPDKDESGHRFVHLRVAPQSSTQSEAMRLADPQGR